MNFESQRVLIIGMARSGIPAAEKLKDLGADVTLIDQSQNPKLEHQSIKLREKGIRTRLGPHKVSDLDNQDLIIPSPGVPSNNSLIIEAEKRAIPIWSEVELAYRLTKCPIVGITGTNGKTTTTSLVGEIFKQAGKKGIVAGNIGYPLIKAVDQEPDTILIVELSSFQLEHTADFCPHISVLLNITEDHLDWHPDFADYIKAKNKLFMNQTEQDFAVINFDDPIVKELAGSLRTNVIPFSKQGVLDNGVYVDDDKIIASIKKRQEICAISDLKIRGGHNLDNAMAATAVSLLVDIPAEDIGKTLSEFKGIAHRIEFVTSLDGVDYFNDSKATNPDATAKALESFESPIVLLVGGRNKGNSFRHLALDIRGKAKAVVLFGEAADEMYLLLRELNLNVTRVNTVLEAVARARNFSKAGDVVLFSPGCASFDQFSDYKERGLVFKDAVINLKKD